MKFLPSFISRFLDGLPRPADENVEEFIKNEEVRSVLRENGDDCRSPRAIQHYAYFPDAKGQKTYLDFVASRGYRIDDEHNEAEGRNAWAVIFSQVQIPIRIDSETAILREYAQTLGGDYDGWETPVIRK